MNPLPKQSNVEDFLAVKANAALDHIANEATAFAGAFKRTREHWRDYGAVLLEKRVQTPDNKQFGKWIVESKLDRAPAGAKHVRADAMWLAEHWDRVKEFCGTFESPTDGLHRPNNIRQACRRAGQQWAMAKPKPQAANKSSKPPRAKLPKTEQSKIEKIILEERAALQARFAHDVEAAVKECVVAKNQELSEALERTKRMHNELSARSKTLDQWMTKEEFKLVRGLLHPDRHPDELERYDRAFQIFSRLEEHLEPDGRVRRGRNW